MARKTALKGRGRDRAKLLVQDDKKPRGEDERGRFVFFHPDLGIGGAERLVVDAAVGLKERGHEVVIFTNHCDPEHCFDECRDGTLDVRVRASNLIPMSIFNRLTILCAILRHLHLLLIITLTGELSKLNPDAFIVDQLSAGQPFLRYLFREVPILFYCHFPDLLLAQGRKESTLKRLYRVPFDWIEEYSMSFAQAVAVNSEFTRGVVQRTWPNLAKSVRTRVVYPAVDVGKDPVRGKGKTEERLLEDHKVILSINRFERKKDIGLALRAFAAIPEDQRRDARLVLAGGYDHRIEENVSYLAELEALATSLSLTYATIPADADATPLITASLINAGATASVLFLPSISNFTKSALLRTARLLVYTPSNEHFGIVPLEAMRARVPVLAATTGGPVETVVDGVTGWLRDTRDEAAWSEVMGKVLTYLTDNQVKSIGEAGLARVKDSFGRDKMAARLEAAIVEAMNVDPPRNVFFNTLINFSIVLVAFIIGLGVAKTFWTVRHALDWLF